MYGTVCSYDWDKDGEPLGIVSNILFVGNGTMHISHLTQANEGIYQCFASNIYGRTMSNFAELRMAVTDSSPETNEITAAEGQSLVIGCRRTKRCFPPPQYSWGLKLSQQSSSSIPMDRRRQIDLQGNCCHLLLVAEKIKIATFSNCQ